MAFNKTKWHLKPIKQVRCHRPENCKLLHMFATYNVVEETETTYLIQFKSLGTKRYDKDRFMDIVPPQPIQPKKTQQLF